MKVVGLTGNVASGKSAVAGFWREAGVPVLSADELAREAVAPGTPGLAEVAETFGEEVLDASGALDRGALRRRVFRDPEARARLEAIVHPRVREARDRWLALQEAAGASLAVVEIPLLFEVGGEGDVDVVVLVDADPELRVARMVEHRGLDREEARRIMSAQMDPGEKRSRSHHVIVNEGTLADLHREAERVLAELRGDGG